MNSTIRTRRSALVLASQASIASVGLVAVDWRATVYLDGRRLVEHSGGYSSLTIDATDALAGCSRDQELVAAAPIERLVLTPDLDARVLNVRAVGRGTTRRCDGRRRRFVASLGVATLIRPHSTDAERPPPGA